MMMVVLRMVMSRGRQMKKKKKKMMMMIMMMMMIRRRRRRRHVTGAILCENLQVKCRRPDGSHDRDPDFVQTCTVEMHLDMSQEQFVGAVAVEMHLDMSEDVRRCQKKPFYSRIYWKNAADQDRDPDFVRACAVEMHLDMSQEPFCTRNNR